MKKIKGIIVRTLKRRLGEYHPILVKLRKLDGFMHKAFSMIKNPAQKLDMVSPKFILKEPTDRYQAWIELNSWNERAHYYLKERLESKKEKWPLISVIMPVYNPPIHFLNEAIASVVDQVYENWELCIADDCSTDPEIRSVLNKWRLHDKRIKIKFLNKNVNISKATNYAVEIADGDFLLFLDHDDKLTTDALGEVALYLIAHPEMDVLYSDDDKITEDGKRYDPQFKPDWSHELLLSYMYFSHIFVVRNSLYQAVGGMREGYEGSQDYDLALRVTEKTRHVGHIPKVLYHWRALPGSTATSGAAKVMSFEAGRRAVQDALDRRKIKASVYRPDFAVKGSLGIYAHKFPDTGPFVTILIPTRNNVKVLKSCIEAIKKTTYQNYKVVIIDNESDDPETLSYLDSLPYKILCIPNPTGMFNFAAINNRAVLQVDSPYILFLNDDVQVQSPGWLNQMMGYAQIEGVGAVGAKLIFPDGRIQHAGIIHGLYHGLAGPAFKLSPEWDHGYLSYASVTRNYSAVTAACMVTPQQLFLDLGGFNEKQFAIAYNDVDYCYRLIDSGYRCVYCPTAELIHYEGHSRGYMDNPSELAKFKSAYRGRKDPYYSPYLSLANEQFKIVSRKLAFKDCKNIPTLMAAFNLNLEGAPITQYELTIYLKERGVIKPIVFCPQDGPLRKAYEEKGIPVYIDDHPLTNVNTERQYDQAILKFSRRLIQWRAQLVYANTLQTFYMIDAARRVCLPSIWNPRESEPWQTYFNFFGPEIAKLALECFSFPYRVIFVSEATRDRYSPLNTRHNFTVIHNAIDRNKIEQDAARWPRIIARNFFNIKDDEVVILLLGTVCPRKGQHDLPLALSKLPMGLHHRIRCFIVGDRESEYSNQLKYIVKNLPHILRKRVTIVPETPDVACYYQSADIFVCTSKIESYPRVILEAMAYKLSIITTPVFGIREQVKEGVNALFYGPGSIEELTKNIEILVTDSALRRRMANNSGYVLEINNNIEDMVQAYAEIFREAYLVSPI